MDIKRIMVIGLESSCTKIVAKMIALNLGLIKDIDSWDGHENIRDHNNEVTHRSLPHGDKRNYTTIQEALERDYVIIVTRDYSCSLNSKIATHQNDKRKAINEHNLGITILKNIIGYMSKNCPEKLRIFSAETAMLLNDAYTIPFLMSINIKNPVGTVFINVNEKYIKDIPSEPRVARKRDDIGLSKARKARNYWKHRRKTDIDIARS